MQQNRLIVVKSHPLMSFYTNPASCVSAAVFDPKMKMAALTHTMNPYVSGTALAVACDCSPEDYLKELPPMAKVKRAFIEKHFDCVLEYHSCDKAVYTDASIRYLYYRFGNRENAGYKLIGGSKDQSVGRSIISFNERSVKDLKTLCMELGKDAKVFGQLSINELNILSAFGSAVSLGLNLKYADILGNGIRVFDFFPATGKIEYSSKTKIRNPIRYENGKHRKLLLGEIIRRIAEQT